MGKLVLDIAVGQRLTSVNECVELCDASGNTIGFFTPATGSLEPQVSDVELDRREREDRTYSTQEVKDHLDKL